jgi:2,5-furandicarboxylate decarboxylase 1
MLHAKEEVPALTSDLHAFLELHRRHFLWIDKPVPLSAVGALTGKANRPIVFTQVENHSMPIVDGLFVDRAAQARILGCEPPEVLKSLNAALARGPRPLVTVNDAPCKEVKLTGDSIDLAALPIVTHTDLDPYPYTTSFVTHWHPGTGTFNAMFPRCGVLGPREMVASFVTPTAWQILAAHKAAGTKMPQSIAIGVHPAWELAAAYTYLHEGWWELELFESLTGEPGHVVTCETNGLPVPADASIVIEGFVDPERTAQDGPSPGPTMLFTPYAAQQPVFEVTAITMRADPIYRNHQMTPFTDHQELPRLWLEAIIHERIRAMGIAVHDVVYLQAGGALLLVLQIDPAFDGQAKDALLAAMGSFTNNKLVVAVDPDIDAHSERDVLFAMATRVDPARDVITVDGTRGWIFDPRARPELDATETTAETRYPAVGSRWGVNATKPAPYKPERRDYDRAWPIGWATTRLEDYL